MMLVLAAAAAGARGRTGRPAVPVPGAAAGRHRGGARRAQRGRAWTPRVLAILGVLSAINAILRALGAGHGRRRAGVLPADPGRPGLRAGLRLRARLHVAVRLGADDRRRRAVAAVPDARARPGSGWAPGCCRAGSPAGAEIAMLVGVRRVRGVRLRAPDEPVRLAVRRWASWCPATRARCRTSPGAPVLENLHRFLVYTLLTSTGSWDTGPRDHQRRSRSSCSARRS